MAFETRPEDKSGEAGDVRRRSAVIDIGSNSVRLVIYDGPVRAPFPICNEKALCGLGRDLSADGALNPQAREAALATLARFRHILDDFGNPPVKAVATAAIREARDGADFVHSAESLGFDIRIISGEREAELAALGVVSFEPSARGLVGDMGGGSLELIRIDGAGAGERASLSIGPLRLISRHGSDVKAAEAAIDAALDDLPWLSEVRKETFYMVGGAWRALARIRMRLRQHPLSILHHYDMTASEAIDVCDLVAHQSTASLAEIPGIARRRIETLPHAARVLKAVLVRTKPSSVFVSAAGLREGLLFEELSDEVKAHDPLVAGARFFARRLAPTPTIGDAVWDMIAPLFSGEAAGIAAGDRARIGRAASLMIDIGAFFHPDLRGHHAFDTALRAPLQGIGHIDRVRLAIALFSRHEGNKSPLPDEAVLRLLTEEARLDATRLGLALRFAGSYAPKSATALAGCRLTLEDGALVFSGPASGAPLMLELPQRRLEALASAYGVPAAIRYG